MFLAAKFGIFWERWKTGFMGWLLFGYHDGICPVRLLSSHSGGVLDTLSVLQPHVVAFPIEEDAQTLTVVSRDRKSVV